MLFTEKHMTLGPTGYEDDDELLDQVTLAGFRRGPGEILEARVFWSKGVPRLGLWRSTNPTPEDDFTWESDPRTMLA
jgi:hypothetical protein